MDALGNVYFADKNNNAIEEWSVADQTVSALVSTGLNKPSGVAVDGQGNLYIADTADNALKQWSPVSRQVTTLVSALGTPMAVGLDGQGGIYVANSAKNTVEEVVFAYLSLSANSLTEGPQDRHRFGVSTVASRHSVDGFERPGMAQNQ